MTHHHRLCRSPNALSSEAVDLYMHYMSLRFETEEETAILHATLSQSLHRTRNLFCPPFTLDHDNGRTPILEDLLARYAI